MNLKKIILLIIIFTPFLTIFTTSDSNAIPAFARRYKISCTTCHAPIPKLKPYGDEFAGNGFIMKENEKARDYVSAGDDLLWLNKDFPVGVRFDAYAVYDEDKPVDKDLQIPWGLKILSGGTLYKNIGYYFYFYFSERGEVAGIEDAYIHFDNIFGSNLDIMVGQFQTSDPLMKRELRLTFEDYMIYKQRFGLSRTNLAYDRGLVFVYGIEKTGTDLIALVVNGNGKDEAGADKKFDDDPFKNFGFRINQGIGKIASIGAYFYKGREKYVYSDGMLGTFENELTYIGPDLNVGIGPIEFTFQYLLRKDTNPFFLSQSEEYKSKGTIAEIIYSPKLDKSRFFLTGLYNKIDSDLYKYETATLSGTYLVARNLRLIAEFTRDLEHDLNRFTLGLVSGF
ncbi:hypothetical protein H8E88_25045 [candidate division KSB1 bacterium]|nr:hypothetical protein [candidate division KSB1 bacterium]MBL7092460.1 hypothetical protein [candidate division KSB1 bacterium]